MNETDNLETMDETPTLTPMGDAPIPEPEGSLIDRIKSLFNKLFL